MTITDTQLKSIFSGADSSFLQQVASELNTDLGKYFLDTPLRCAHFFAQVMQEAGAALEAQVESMNYDPKGLIKNFKFYRNHPDEAQQDGRSKDPTTGKILHPANQPVIANKAYASRNGNGDIASGDGFRFRGRGFIQVTGRGNYSSLTGQYKKTYGTADVDFVANPELVAEFPHSIRSAVCFWIQHGLPALADRGGSDANVDAITAVINKDTDSFDARRKNFKKALAAFQ